MKETKSLENQHSKKVALDQVEEERLADLARERERDIKQMEMFDDPYMNWSGHH